jgi:chloramphenicol 3-O-phosphotransferase
VILNGASSSGKTTLATAFRDQQAAVGEFWLLIGIDDFLSKLPPAWLDLGLPTGPGKRAIEGLRFGTTPTGRDLVVGETCRQLLHVYHHAVAAAARSGLNVIVDDVVVDEGSWMTGSVCSGSSSQPGSAFGARLRWRSSASRGEATGR